MMKPEDEVPSLFKDPSFGTSKYWAISTSNLSSEFFENWGWGEVVDDGIGVRCIMNALDVIACCIVVLDTRR
jgi:carnitine O-acetyltransferase